MLTSPFDLSVLIVTYKTKDMVLDCIRSSMESCQKAGVRFQIIVVDNASGDGTIEAIREEFPQVKLIANADNLGPAKAYNQALRLAMPDSKYVMLLNSDIIVWPDTVGNMYRYLEDNPEISGVCGDLLFPDGRRQKIRTSIVSLRKPDYTQRFPATFVGSGFNMMRVAAFEKVGLYDENYYFYNEDLDWAERAKRAGLKFMFLPEAKVYHYQGQGSRQNYHAIIKELYKSNLYYFRKFYHPIIAELAYRLMLAEIFLKMNRLKREANNQNTPDYRKAELKKSLDNLYEARQQLVRYKKGGPTGHDHLLCR